MKVVVISNSDSAPNLFDAAREQGYITFIYHHADPEQSLSCNKFMYIHTDSELMEKLNLLRADSTLQDEIVRW